MKAAVLNEISASHRNADILAALQGLDVQVLNLGMTHPDQQPALTYIHTGLMAAILLGTGAVDVVIGGCGTGQGFLNAAMQYPGVCCGLITEPLDGWLFSRINDGNCISLVLNKGYGWAGDQNLRLIFAQLFGGGAGEGYPPTRCGSQRDSRTLLRRLSSLTHLPLQTILPTIPEEVLRPLAGTAAFMRALETLAAPGPVGETALRILQPLRQEADHD